MFGKFLYFDSSKNFYGFEKILSVFFLEMEICKVMVTRSMTNKRYGNALEWAIRSRENIYVTNVANVFLQV